MNVLNTTTRLISAAAAVAATTLLLAAPAQAQQADGRALSRAEVNQETLAAMKSGTIVSGEGLPQGPASVAVSTKTREERKAETMQARRNGEFYAGGLGTYMSNVVAPQRAMAKSTKTRAERKSETMEAIKDHKTMQPGEAA
jgi:hypothetical protein